MRGPNPLLPDAGEPFYDTGSVWQQAARATYDRLALAALEWGRARGVRWLGNAGRMAQVCRLQPPDWRAIHELFPDLKPVRAREVAGRCAGLRFMNRAAIALVHRRGIGSLVPILDGSCTAAPRLPDRGRGLILVAFHVGAHFGVGAALRQWGVEALSLRELPLAGPEARARVLKHAIDHVRAGGTILAVLDGPGGASTGRVRCLGRDIVLRRGPLVLARVTGAPVVPVVARWTERGSIEARVGEPTAAGPDVEASLAGGAARWLEQHLLAHPHDLWPYTLANLLAAPRAAGVANVATALS